MAEEDADRFSSELPANMRSLVEHMGLLDELDDPTAEQMYSKVREGKCLACSGVLGGDTIFLVNTHGIVGAYCGGQCMSDFAVLGWIQEQHEDLVDSMNFRGGRGDEPET